MTTNALPVIGIVREGVAVNIWLDVGDDNGTHYCLIHTLSGRIKLGPKAWLKAVREEVSKLERIAKASGCAEMRIEGRDWLRVLPGYQRWPEGEGYAIRKVL